MRKSRSSALGLGLILVLLAFAVTNYQQVGLAQQARKMRWDIQTYTSFSPPTFKEGGALFSSATDGSFIRLTGSGTFGPGESDPVTGGGAWETFTVSRVSTAKGAYTVTGLVSWQEESSGKLPANFVDQIGPNPTARSGLAALRVAYRNADGSPAGTGILIVSCHLPGAPDSIFEGVIAVKGVVTYYERALTMPGVDANRTIFHTQ